MLAFTFAVSVLTGIVFGVFPGADGVSQRSERSVEERSRGTGAGLAHMKFRNVLAGAELAISLVLLVGAGLTVKSLFRVVQADAGFETDGVLAGSFSLPDNQYKSDEQKRLFVQQLGGESFCLTRGYGGWLQESLARRRANWIYG